MNAWHAERVEGCGCPVDTSKHRRCLEAPTEPAGETKSFCPCQNKKTPSRCLFCFGKTIVFTEARACRASSPKRTRWVMKRGEDGAAVKICRRSKPKQILGTARGHSLTFCPCQNEKDTFCFFSEAIQSYSSHSQENEIQLCFLSFAGVLKYKN